jgi:hypothetical protein
VADRDPDLDALMAAQRLIADLSERLYGGGDDDGLDLMVDDPNVRVFRSDAPFSRL